MALAVIIAAILLTVPLLSGTFVEPLRLLLTPYILAVG
jgi:hypothetical protein